MAKTGNCFSAQTKFVTDQGLRAFSDFEDGDSCNVLSSDGRYYPAVVHSYGKQMLNEITFSVSRRTNTRKVYATANHRWILKDKKETTRLRVENRLLPPTSFYRNTLDWDNLPYEKKLLWCQGFAFGTGVLTEEHPNDVYVDLYGTKMQFMDRFKDIGYKIFHNPSPRREKYTVIVHNYHGEIPCDDAPLDEVAIFINGIYQSCGEISPRKNSGKIHYMLVNNDPEVKDYLLTHADSCGLYITKYEDFLERSESVRIHFNPEFLRSCYTIEDIKPYQEEEVWCLEVEDTHNFVLSGGMVTGNCSEVKEE